MTGTATEFGSDDAADQLGAAVRRIWGYPALRPLQLQAMLAAMQARDALVVLPTGGGKSLCYQAPAVCRDGLAVVVSPLISLMKDQVDALQALGVPAACINSLQTPQERLAIADQVRSGDLKLLYIAPERLVQERTLDFLADANVSLLAIDEAHCISQWGHDFRPEYRQLRQLKQVFPGIGVQALTATATRQVRDDIAEQLGLDNPDILVGSFHRPNLHYRVVRRADPQSQIADILRRHPRESGIIYCISRRNVESTSRALNALGFQTLPYHAGLDDEIRIANQNAFIEERVSTIVATVAFGMGIDKSNVRYVIHAEMPKSLEHYQQESGRAGRDGLEAECVLLYAAGDIDTWRFLLDQSEDAEARAAAERALTAMQHYCVSLECRHRQLAGHFGETLTIEACGACDICCRDLELVPDALVTAQKILSCVVRVRQRFGAAYVAQVLRGSRARRILDNRHDELSTWGLMKGVPEQRIRTWIDQLVAEGCLEAVGEYNVLQVTETGRAVLKGDVTPPLRQPRDDTQPIRTGPSTDAADGGLFESLRQLRTRLAAERNVPPYIVFGDATLRELARLRPAALSELSGIYGIGRKKLDEYGEILIGTIAEWEAESAG